MYKLLTYEDNWADEMNIDGIYVFKNDNEYNKFMDMLKIVKKQIEDDNEFTFYIGTNEEISYSKTQSDIDDCFTIDIIDEDEYQVLKRLKITNVGFASSFVKNVIDFYEYDDKELEDED